MIRTRTGHRKIHYSVVFQVLRMCVYSDVLPKVLSDAITTAQLVAIAGLRHCNLTNINALLSSYTATSAC